MKRHLLLAVLCLAPALAARADDSVELFRFREPIVVEEGDDIATAMTIGSSIRVDGTVKESAIALGGDIELGPQGGIEGDAIAIGGRVVKPSGAFVGGKVTQVPFSLSRIRHAIAVAIPTMIVGMGALVGAALVLGSIGSIALAVLVLALFPEQTAAARDQVDRHPIKTLFVGFLVLMMCFPILIFLFITLIGIPLSFIAAALMMAALVLGTVAVGQSIGLRIAKAIRRPIRPFPAGLIGLGVLTVAAALPYIGVLLQAMIVCAALGSVAFSRFRSVNA